MARYVDPIIGLITGKFETVVKKTGGTYQQFIPFKKNKYTPLVELYRTFKSQTKEEIKIREGILPPLHSVDRSVFAKTSDERELLKEMKKSIKKDILDLGHNPKKRMNTSPLIKIRL